MSHYLLDTCGVAAVLLNTAPPTVTHLLDKSDVVCTSAISFFEIGQKVRVGKWPDMEPYVVQLSDLMRRAGVQVLAVDQEIAINAATMAWAHPDSFDRIIVATAKRHRLTVVTSDRAIGAFIPTVWSGEAP